jgi:hypothetical protein
MAKSITPAKKPSAPKQSPKKAAAPASAEAGDGVAPVTGNEAAYDHFVPATKSLAAASVKAFRADASLAYHNVLAGVKALLEVRAALDGRIRAIEWTTIERLPELALAVCFAASQVETTAVPVTGTAAKLAEARKLRNVLITAADALAAAGVIPLDAVAKIHAGRGLIDLANDCVALAALFRKYAAKIARQHAVTAAQITRSADVGSELVAVLKPKRARKGEKAEVLATALDVRNRLWTLLIDGHRELRRLGAFQWVEEVDEHVPALQAYRAGARKKSGAGGTGAGKGTAGKEAKVPPGA